MTHPNCLMKREIHAPHPVAEHTDHSDVCLGVRDPDTGGINVAWENTVDGGLFRCWVEQPDGTVMFAEAGGKVSFDDRDTTGKLFVQHVPSGELLLDEPTDISHGAIFGPDMFDVERWAGQCIMVIDQWYTDHGMTPPG